MKATGASLSLSPMIARSIPVLGAVLPALQPASAAPVERQVRAELAEPPESAAATAREEPRACAAKLTRMAADPSHPELQASSAIGLAILIPRPGSPGDYRSLALGSGRSERESR
ncbi:MAG TPA: hypothetical protein VK478_12425 [Gemmatimonadaceae bacterium]|nr:hypothetical protein [Gemmatimonadaceae bacterium]